MLFGQDARSSKSNFIGCFDPNCHVASVVEGMVAVSKLNYQFEAFSLKDVGLSYFLYRKNMQWSGKNSFSNQ